MRDWRAARRGTPEYRERQRKENARHLLGYALKRGMIQRGPCAECGTDINIQGHHTDYEKPLQVIWLCRYHHDRCMKEFEMLDPAKFCRECGRFKDHNAPYLGLCNCMEEQRRKTAKFGTNFEDWGS